MERGEARRGWLLCVFVGAMLLFVFWIGSYFYMQHARIAVLRAWVEMSNGEERDMAFEYVRYDRTKWTERGLFYVHYPLELVRNRFFSSFGHELHLE